MADQKQDNQGQDSNNDNKVQLRVNKRKCMMCGACASMYPDYFNFSDDGSHIDDSKAQVGQDEVDEIIATCPQRAIHKEE